MTDLLPSAAGLTGHRLSNGGVEIVLAAHPDGLPVVVHWGAPLGNVDVDQLRLAQARQIAFSAYDRAWPLTVLPAERDGWEGRPALSLIRDGRALRARWSNVRIEPSGAESLLVTARDVDQRLELELSVALDAHGVLRIELELENDGTEAVELAAFEATIPVGDAAGEVLDFAGRWTRERAPQRGPLLSGTRVRESRRGRTGHDSPLLLAAGTPGFGAATGEVWATHLAWSGDAVYRTDALPESSTVLGAGPLLQPGELVLAPGERYRTPTAVFVWSDEGLDGISDRLHRSLRARPGHPSAPRPVTLNTWEAVYFSHDLVRLTTLAEQAAALGVERFVLDDGWFLGRRDDRAGLGDWKVDPSIWPEGLGSLAQIVRGLGMQFGLWFEPEMVSPDSDLIAVHPEWLLEPLAESPRTWRHQYLLDLARPDVFAYLFESISTLVEEVGIDFIKWDMNRDVVDAVHDGRAGVLRHTHAVYELMDALRSRHAGLEIESCASGGARVDLGVLEHADRVWPSDTNDPVERLDIQRGTEILLPLELIGTHVGAERSHTTGRTTDLGFRIATALFGSFGIEWDISACTPDELEQLGAAIRAYRRLRPLLHEGRLRHSDGDDGGLRVTSVISTDRHRGVVRVARVASSQRSLPALLRVPGLDEGRLYRITPVRELRMPQALDATQPPWLEHGAIELNGAALRHRGIRLPLLGPGQAVVLEIELSA